MPRAALGLGGRWAKLAEEAASPPEYLHLPDRQLGEPGPAAGLCQVCPGARGQAHHWGCCGDQPTQLGFLCRGQQATPELINMEERDEAEITARPLFFISWTLTAQCPHWPGYLPAYKGEEDITDFHFFFL